ncbi:MAG: glycosyltransferase family 39 protein, partial [Anaerolineae bacterium]|nr:glycosyltransferase family 39 protein [Anaerolineae bacterium]
MMVVILLLAAVPRAANITRQSIWFDEGWSAYAANRPTITDAIAADPTNPPLYYMLINVFVKGTGDSELALRWFSLLLGLLGIALAYQLARRLFGIRAGWWAAWLVAFSPLLWWASQEVRMYTLLALLVLLAALGWHDVAQADNKRGISWRSWGLLWSSELALLYAHNTGPVIVLWLNAVTLLAWITRRTLCRPDWRIWFGGQIGVALLWSPWFITRFLLLPGANSAVVRPPEWSLALFGQLWQALWAGPWAMVGADSTLPWLALVIGGAAVLLIPWRDAKARWLIVHTVILTLGLLLGLTILGTHIHGRYLVMIAPLPLIVIGAGIARIRFRPAQAALLAGFAGVFLFSLNAAQNPAYGHDDARGMVRYYAGTLTAGDTV